MLDRTDQRHKDARWTIRDSGNGVSFDGAQLAVLMDIRDELKLLNQLLHCQNFLEMPHLLRCIERNTKKRKRRKSHQTR